MMSSEESYDVMTGLCQYNKTNMLGNPLMMFLLSGDMPDAPNLGAAGMDPLTGGMTDPLLAQVMRAQIQRQLRNARPTSQTVGRHMQPDWRRPRSGSDLEANTGPDPRLNLEGATAFDNRIGGKLSSSDRQAPVSNSIVRDRSMRLGFTPPPGADHTERPVQQTLPTGGVSVSGRKPGDVPPLDAMGPGDMGERPIDMPPPDARGLMDTGGRPGDMPPPDVMGPTNMPPMMDRMPFRKAMSQARMGSMRPPVDTLTMLRRLRALQHASMSPGTSESGALSDRRADLADMRADRMDNLQALGPMGILQASGGLGGGGLGGMGGGLGGLSGMGGLGGLGADGPSGLASMMAMMGGAGGAINPMMALLGGS